MTETQANYKDTLNLPQTDFPADALTVIKSVVLKATQHPKTSSCYSRDIAYG